MAVELEALQFPQGAEPQTTAPRERLCGCDGSPTIAQCRGLGKLREAGATTAYAKSLVGCLLAAIRNFGKTTRL
jgi:hypothetical protein